MGFFSSVFKLGKKVVGGVARLGKKADASVRRHFSSYKGVDAMGDHDKVMARMADTAYDSTGKAKIGDYEFQNALSTEQEAVYHDPKSKRTVVSFRGTVPTDARDLVSDKAIVLGRESSDPRYKKSLQVYDRVKARDAAHRYRPNVY